MSITNVTDRDRADVEAIHHAVECDGRRQTAERIRQQRERFEAASATAIAQRAANAELDAMGRGYLRFRRIVTTVIVIVALCTLVSLAYADANLPAICKDGVRTDDCAPCSSTVYDVPQAADLVQGNGQCWARWELFGGPSSNVAVCPADIARGARSCPVALLSVARDTWAPIATTFKSPVHVSWTAVDGVAGYEIAHGATVGSLGTVLDVGNVAAHNLPLPDGTRSLTVRTYNAQGERSDNGPVVSFTMLTPSVPKPSPPATVSATVQVYDDVQSVANQVTWKLIGTVPAGTKYLPFAATSSDGVTRCGIAKTGLKRAAGVTSTPNQVYAACQ